MPNQPLQHTAGRDRRFVWDVKQTLTSVSDNGIEAGRYDYGADGLRNKRLTALESVEYVLDGMQVLVEADGLNPSHPATRRYTYGATALAVTDISGATRTTKALHLDALGSPSVETTQAGAVAAVRQYDAWGQYRNGTAPVSTDAKLGYTGHQFDPETGLVYARARYYDPEYGRFLSRDSLEGTLNSAPSLHRFAYARENPLRYVDINGRDPAEISPQTYAVIGALERAEKVGIVTSKDYGGALSTLTERYQAGDKLEPVDETPFLQGHGGSFSVSPDLRESFRVLLEVPDVKEAVENTQELGTSAILRTPDWVERRGAGYMQSWAFTEYVSPTTVRTILKTEMIALSNKGGRYPTGGIKGQKPWTQKHSNAELLAHEIGHTEGMAIVTRGNPANVVSEDPEALQDLTFKNARALGESVRRAYGLGGDHSEAQSHPESGSRAEAQEELRKEAAKRAPRPPQSPLEMKPPGKTREEGDQDRDTPP